MTAAEQAGRAPAHKHQRLAAEHPLSRIGCYEGHNGLMASPTRYETQFPDLFAALTPERRASVSAALADDRLEGGEVRRADVELLIRSVTENLSDAEYLAAVLELTNSRHVRTHG